MHDEMQKEKSIKTLRYTLDAPSDIDYKRSKSLANIKHHTKKGVCNKMNRDKFTSSKLNIQSEGINFHN